MMNEPQHFYRRSAIQGASPIGLLLILYDALSGDLRRAAKAIRERNIEARCDALNHAALILGQLEDWVGNHTDARLKESLVLFYAHLRARMMEAAVKQSAELLDAQIELVLMVRTSWQQREAASLENAGLSRHAVSADKDETSAGPVPGGRLSQSA
jgi:flagellar protein FliS